MVVIIVDFFLVNSLDCGDAGDLLDVRVSDGLVRSTSIVDATGVSSNEGCWLESFLTDDEIVLDRLDTIN